jgi:hypothetical protein
MACFFCVIMYECRYKGYRRFGLKIWVQACSGITTKRGV